MWQQIQDTFPELPMYTDQVKYNGTVIYPGDIIPPKSSNSENTELYPVHPFRIYQFYKPETTII